MRDDDTTLERNVPTLLKPAGQQLQTGGAAAVVAREAAVATLVHMAQQFPRNPIAARHAINNAFTDPSLAAVAQYEYVKGGNEIEGASIHSARAIMLNWGRMEAGIAPLSVQRGPDGVMFTECEAWAFDYEAIARRFSRFIVRHWRTTRAGGYPLHDDREIADLIANIGARRERGCILALIPRDIVEGAMKQAEVTNAQKADVSEEGIEKMLALFLEQGVSREMIERRIQRPVSSITPTQYLALRKVYTSLRDGASRPGQHFDVVEAPPASNVEQRVAKATPPPKATQPITQNTDVADLLHRITTCQTFEELQQLEEESAHYPEADRAVIVETLKSRDRQLDGGTDNNGDQSYGGIRPDH